jgi:hypothetical protein
MIFCAINLLKKIKKKRQRSLTEAVLISFGSTDGFPKTI